MVLGRTLGRATVALIPGGIAFFVCLAAGFRPAHPLLLPLALLFNSADRDHVPKRERQTTTRCSVSGDCRGGKKDFCQATWERTGSRRPIVAKIPYCR